MVRSSWWCVGDADSTDSGVEGSAEAVMKCSDFDVGLLSTFRRRSRGQISPALLRLRLDFGNGPRPRLGRPFRCICLWSTDMYTVIGLDTPRCGPS